MYDVVLLIGLLRIVRCQAPALFHRLRRRFRCLLPLLCLHLISLPFDHRFQDLMRPARPTRSMACRHITVFLLRLLLGFTRR